MFGAGGYVSVILQFCLGTQRTKPSVASYRSIPRSTSFKLQFSLSLLLEEMSEPLNLDGFQSSSRVSLVACSSLDNL